MTEPAAGLEAGQVCMFGESKAREAMVILRALWVSWAGWWQWTLRVGHLGLTSIRGS